MAAERTGVGPQSSSQRFVDDRDRFRPDILRCKKTAFEKRRFHRGEIVRSDNALIDLEARQVSSFSVGSYALECKSAAPVVAAERQMRNGCRGYDTWQRLDLFQKLRVKTSGRRAVFVFRARDLNLHRQNIVRIESGIDLRQTAETFHKQPGPNQQHQR